MLYYIQKVNYTAYLFLIDKASAGICFASVKTDLFLCFLFYVIILFSLKVLVPSRSLLFLWVWNWMLTVTHQPFCGESFAFSPQTDIISSWKAFQLGDMSLVQQSSGGAMAIHTWPAAVNMTSISHLRSSVKYLCQTAKVQANLHSSDWFLCWLVLEETHEHHVLSTLHPISEAEEALQPYKWLLMA